MTTEEMLFNMANTQGLMSTEHMRKQASAHTEKKPYLEKPAYINIGNEQEIPSMTQF